MRGRRSSRCRRLCICMCVCNCFFYMLCIRVRLCGVCVWRCPRAYASLRVCMCIAIAIDCGCVDVGVFLGCFIYGCHIYMNLFLRNKLPT